jgi:cell division protein FtsQ
VRAAAPPDRRFRRAHVRPSRRRHTWMRAIAVVRSVVAFALFATACCLVGLEVAQARALHVDHIVVRGNQRLATTEVLGVVEGLQGEHVLAVDLSRWRQRLLASPWVGQASLRRVLPSTIEIAISERRPIAIGRLGRELYLIDAEGRVIDEYGPNYAQFDLPIVDGLGAPPSDGGAMVDEERTDVTNRLLASVGEHPPLLRRISQIDVSNARDVVVLLENDTTLVHLGDDQFVERLQAYVDLSAALHDRVPDIEYVDVRFDNHVYVRPVAGRRAAGH